MCGIRKGRGPKTKEEAQHVSRGGETRKVTEEQGREVGEKPGKCGITGVKEDGRLNHVTILLVKQDCGQVSVWLILQL